MDVVLYYLTVPCVPDTMSLPVVQSLRHTAPSDPFPFPDTRHDLPDPFLCPSCQYCTSFLKNIKCVNPNCLYLHDGGEESDSFTKEEMLAQYGAKNTKAFQDAARSAGGVGGAGSAQGNPAGPAILQLGSPHQGVGGYKGNNFNPHYSLGNQTLNQAPGRERFDPGGATGPGSSRGNLFARDDRFGDKKTGNGVRGNGNGENGGFSNGAFHAEPTSGTRGVTRDVRPAGGGGGGHSSSSLRGGIPAPRLGFPVLGTNCGARNGNGGVNGKFSHLPHSADSLPVQD